MNNKEHYNNWSAIYDTNVNKTRDLEAIALRKNLGDLRFNRILEIGCGTGKNSEFLLTKTQSLTCVDFSEEMLEKARQKITAPNVSFVLADITEKWKFKTDSFDLVTFSLVLEHIGNLDFIFQQANAVLKKDGLIYVGELHPFKQYAGTKAKYETPDGFVELECCTHHISAFYNLALLNYFVCEGLSEWFDDDNRAASPRILSMIFRKTN